MTNKKIPLLIFGLMLITISLVAIGCKPSTTKTTVETKTPAVEAVKPIELRFSSVVTTLHPNYKNFQLFSEEISKRTNGKVKITVYPSGTLSSPMESYNAVKNGLADIAAAPVGYSPALMPLNKLVGDAMMGMPNAVEAAKVWNTLYKSTPALQKELADVHVLWLTSTSPLAIGTTSKKISKLEDFKGLIMRFPPGLEPVAKAWGISPINMPVGDIYVAMQKKSVGGFFGGAEMLETNRLAEFTTNATNTKMVYGLSYCVVNQKVWDSFPADIQKIFTEVGDQWGVTKMVEAFDEAEKKSRDFAVSKGTVFNEIAPEELVKIYAISTPVFDKIASDLEAKGLPAIKVLSDLRKLSAQK